VRLELPDPSLVVLIGASGSGKSSFARKRFAPTEVISSDFCRGLVADDENDQSATKDAFAVLQFIAGRRLAQPRFTVVDATNVQREARRPLVELAKQHDLFPVAIVLDTPEAICQERNRSRPDRTFGPHVVRQQRSQLQKSLRGLQREGFRRVHVMRSLEEIDSAEVHRTPLWTDRRTDHGPFDVIGDVHGCYSELAELMGELGYEIGAEGVTVTAPKGRRAVFVGDYGDRGPDTEGAQARDGDGERRDRDLPARQPRRQAGAKAQRPRRADHARPCPDTGAARRAARGVSRSGARLSRQAGQPRRAR